MNIMNKLFLVPLAALILTTTACSDKKNTSTNSAKQLRRQQTILHKATGKRKPVNCLLQMQLTLRLI